MQALHERGESPDRIMVVEELVRRGHLESIGGLLYLADITAELPDITNLPGYVRIVLEKANLRAIALSAKKAFLAALEGNTEASEIARAAETELQEIRPAHEILARSPMEIVEQYPGGISSFLDPSQRQETLATKYRKLDEMMGGGFRPEELIILAARPSQGKSSLLMNIVANVVLAGTGALVFSLEMSGASLLARMVCAAARVDQHKFRGGYLNQEDRRRLQEALDRLANAPLWICDKSGIGVPEIQRVARKMRKQIGLVGIDYLQLLASKEKSENRNIEVGRITTQTKWLAMELGIPIILLSQLSRANEKRPGDKRPMLSDLLDSGKIEADADTVLFIFREELYKRDREDLKGLADLIVAKQRNGPTGVVPLRFLGQFTRFENRAEDIGE